MSRRLAAPFAFIAIWVVILTVPELRYLLRVEAEPHNLGYGLDLSADWKDDAQAVADRYPNDAALQAVAIERARDRRPNLGVLRPQEAAYDMLIRRFPNDPRLMAWRLENTMYWWRLDRGAGRLNGAPGPGSIITAQTNFLSYGAMAQYRETTLLITALGVQAQKNGEDDKAIRIYGDLALVQGLCAKSARDGVELLVSFGMQRIPVGAYGRNARRVGTYYPPLTMAKLDRQTDANFAAYAAAHGQAPLGRAVQTSADDVVARYQGFTAALSQDSVYPREPLEMSFQAWWLGTAHLLVLLTLLPLWALLCAILYERPVSGAVRIRDWAVPLALGVAPTALLLVGAVTWNLGRNLPLQYGGPPWQEFLVLGAVPLPTIILIGSCGWRARYSRELARLRSEAAAGARWLALRAALEALRCTDLLGLVFNLSLAIFAFAAIGRWGIQIIAHGIPSDADVRYLPFWLIPAASVKSYLPHTSPLWCLVFYVGLLAMLCTHWWFVALRRRDAHLMKGLHALRTAFGAMIVIASLSYLLCSLAALAVRRQADAEMDTIINIGEVPAMAKLRANGE